MRTRAGGSKSKKPKHALDLRVGEAGELHAPLDGTAGLPLQLVPALPDRGRVRFAVPVALGRLRGERPEAAGYREEEMLPVLPGGEEGGEPRPRRVPQWRYRHCRLGHVHNSLCLGGLLGTALLDWGKIYMIR